MADNGSGVAVVFVVGGSAAAVAGATPYGAERAVTVLDAAGKADVIRDTAAGYPHISTFVETGTATGATPLRLAPHFARLVTIEADTARHEQAATALRDAGIEAWHGDSAVLLADALTEPAVVFLDAHVDVIGGHSPLEEEIGVIGRSPFDHVVLVDDARLCRDADGWLSVDVLAGHADRWGYRFEVKDDIVRMLP